MFVEIEKAQIGISKNVAKYWKWLENNPGAPENIVLILIFGKGSTQTGYLSHKETADFMGKKMEKISYVPFYDVELEPETIANLIYGEINR
jgi:hypothetical protein